MLTPYGLMEALCKVYYLKNSKKKSSHFSRNTFCPCPKGLLILAEKLK
jgi:hypothetical protein